MCVRSIGNTVGASPPCVCPFIGIHCGCMPLCVSCIMHHTACIMYHEICVIKYDAMKYGVMKYEVIYDVMIYDVMKYEVMKYEVMKYDIMKMKKTSFYRLCPARAYKTLVVLVSACSPQIKIQMNIFILPVVSSKPSHHHLPNSNSTKLRFFQPTNSKSGETFFLA